MQVKGSWDKAGWAAEPHPQGPYVLIRVNLSSEAAGPLRLDDRIPFSIALTSYGIGEGWRAGPWRDRKRRDKREGCGGGLAALWELSTAHLLSCV